MILVPCEQGSPEWIAARLGIPTASQFDRLITPKTAKESAAADGYLNDLLAEWLTGEPLDPAVTEWMQRGRELEAQAVRYYELERDLDVTRVGVCLTDDRAAGCSPDGLVGEDGGLEIKCLGASAHMAYLRALDEGLPTKHYAQVQGGLYVTGRAWWDLLAFHRDLPPALLRYDRDDVFIAKLATILTGFTAQLREVKERLIARGYHPPEAGVSDWLTRALQRSLTGVA